MRAYVRLFSILLFLAALAAGYATRQRWLPLMQKTADVAEDDHDHAAPSAPSEEVKLSEQAQKNLKLDAKPLKPESFWKTIEAPGSVVDRPGHGDHSVTAPVAGVVVSIKRVPGDSVNPGEPLFVLRIQSEAIRQTQTELFKATQELKLALEQKQRLTGLPAGSVSEARLIDADNAVSRLKIAIQSHRSDLTARGFPDARIDEAAAGKFVTELTVDAPPAAEPREVQELKIELGQQAAAGQVLCLLADHRNLAIEGRAFREETPLLERALREDWPVDVDFQEDPGNAWPTLSRKLGIGRISNTIDPVSRTFTFQIPLENQFRTVEHDGRTTHLWRFRPGHPVRLRLRTEKMDNVFVLPPGAVVKEGGESYVFRQNGDNFERKPVRVLYADRQNVVLANDGAVAPGTYVVRENAAVLNRMVKSQSGTVPKGFHIHADGSVHMGSH